jgi:histidinol-phosphatase
VSRFADELAFAHELAALADTRTTAAFGGRQAADTKADGTWVTAVDVDVERTLRAAIRSRFPEHAVLGEEDGLDGPAAAPTWVIDPIDGTTNFVKGNPVFATLIGLRIDDDDVLGVVSAPALGSRWSGVVGEGADHNGRPIEVSTIDRLADAEVAFGGIDYFRANGHGDLVADLSARSARQRGYGDFWQHCLVASGSTEVALEAEVNLWDLVAVKALVEAAGGRFTSLMGERTAAGGSALSSNGLLHDEVLAVVAANR